MEKNKNKIFLFFVLFVVKNPLRPWWLTALVFGERLAFGFGEENQGD